MIDGRRRRLRALSTDDAIRAGRRPSRVAVLTGAIFVFAGLVKFVFHHWELHAFRSFGLPWPSALEVTAGVVEVAGGVLLVLRRLVVPVALVLAVTMVVAIAASGIGHGDVIPSLTLAPALLIALAYLLNAALSRPRRVTPSARETTGELSTRA
ncbi:MAG TPA: DoxX family membrane protein [Solirubrobacteraceae bacterium]